MKAVPVQRRAAVVGTKDDRTVEGRKTRKRIKDRRTNAKLMVEALEIASTYDIPIVKGNGVIDVLQQVLDRTMDLWRHACKQVDSLDETEWLVEKIDHEGNILVEPNIWMQYEATLRAELMDLSLRMGHLGVDERKVRVQEAQVELLGRAIQAACAKIDMPAEVQRQFGAALRDELKLLEAGSQAPATVSNGNERSPVINGSVVE